MLRKKQKSNSLLGNIFQLYHFLDHRRRIQLGVLLLLLIITSFSEMISLGAIFPFLSALSNAQTVLQDARWQPILNLLQLHTPQQVITVLAFSFIGAALVANGLRLLTLNLRIRLAAAIGSDISSRVYYTMLRQPYSFHVRQNSSDLIQTVTIDTDRLTNAILNHLLNILANAFLVPALIATLFLIDGKVTLGAAVLLGGTYVIIFYVRRHLLKQNSIIFSRAGQKKVQAVQEGLGGIRDVLLDNSQVFFEQAYLDSETALKQSQATNAIIAQSPTFVLEAVALSAIALLALSLGQDGDFSQAVPVLGSLALGAKRLLPALQQVFASLANMQGAQASLKRVLVALQRPIDPLLLITADKPLGLQQELRFEQVWFRYGDEGDWVLRGLNLTIKAKTTVAFVGSTGSGKSTTADLLLGLLQPQKGKIWIDGEILEGNRLRHWQRSIAHVPQQIFLSDGTLAENIAFGVPKKEIDFAKVRRAARLAQIEEFIEELPAKYETYVGEQGVRLSGGQRQRIGIARALYKNASVIIFDEATSALDNATEREVMAAIDGLNGEFTIILIAHRLSTVKNCDLVIELDSGQSTYQGSYDELIAKSSTFRRMVERA